MVLEKPSEEGETPVDETKKDTDGTRVVPDTRNPV